ncbi:hypothetical protein V8F06_013673 [Rhypophila decipiens]
MYLRTLLFIPFFAEVVISAPSGPTSEVLKRQCVDKWPIGQCAPYVQDCWDPSIGLRLRQNCAKTCGVCTSTHAGAVRVFLVS